MRLFKKSLLHSHFQVNKWNLDIIFHFMNCYTWLYPWNPLKKSSSYLRVPLNPRGASNRDFRLRRSSCVGALGGVQTPGSNSGKVENSGLSPLKTNISPWKMMVGSWFRCISYWNSPLLGEMLVFWGVVLWLFTNVPPSEIYIYIIMVL